MALFRPGQTTGGTSTTASYITSSGVDGPYGMDSILSASHAVDAVVTASYAGSTITFYKGDGTQFDIPVVGGGGPSGAGLALEISGNNLSITSASITLSTVRIYPASSSFTASFVTSSNVWGPFGSNSILSASYAKTGSYSISSSYAAFALTASYAMNGGGGGGGTPAPSDTYIQYNQGGSFGASQYFRYNYVSQSILFGENLSGSYLSLVVGVNSTAGAYTPYNTGSVALGQNIIASGRFAIGTGYGTNAPGHYSHTEGNLTQTYGYAAASHAEGNATIVYGSYSHAEGKNTAIGGIIGLSVINPGGPGSQPGQASLKSAFGDITNYFTPGNRLLVYFASQSLSTDGVVIFNSAPVTTNLTIVTASFQSGQTQVYVDDITFNFDDVSSYGVYIADIGPFQWNSSDTPSAISPGTIANAAFASNQPIGPSHAHAEGRETIAYGEASHVEGYVARTFGQYSHAEGYSTTAFGESSHAEGSSNYAVGNFSHAEGAGTEAWGSSSHTEGEEARTTTSATAAHAEGNLTVAIGPHSHAEGYSTKTGTTKAYYAESIVNGVITLSASYGDVRSYFTVTNDYGRNNLYYYDEPFDNSYVRASYPIAVVDFDGTNTIITIGSGIYGTAAYVGDIMQITNWTGDQIIPGQFSHTEGSDTLAIGLSSHAEGGSTQAIGNYSHAEGISSVAVGAYSHAEGNGSIAYGEQSHAEGGNSKVIGPWTHAEGYNTIAVAQGSHAEGYFTTTEGSWSHTEGTYTTASGWSAHAEGSSSIASGYYTHAEGNRTYAIGDGSHTEGSFTTSSGIFSHAEGSSSIAFGIASHAGGLHTIASASFATTIGKYNQHNNTTALFTIGDGTSNTSRHDLLNAGIGYVRVSGSAIVSSSLEVVGLSKVTGSLIVSNSFELVGLGRVTGSYIVSSSLNVIGTSTTTGSAIISSSLNVIGASNVTGSNNITGSWNLVGDGQVTGSLNITGSLIANYAYLTGSLTGSFLGTGSGNFDGRFLGQMTGSLTGSFKGTGSGFFDGIFSGSDQTGVSFYGTSSWAISSLTASYADNFRIAGNLEVFGTASVSYFIAMYQTSSIIYSSGSTKFGDTQDDTHQFTGSVSITGSVTSTGGFTGSLFGTSSWAVNALTSSYSTGFYISGSIANVDYIDFNTGSTTPTWKSGRVFWDNTEGALAVYNAEQDITLQVGQENWVRVSNRTGATIVNGAVVRLIGAHGDVPEIALAQSIAVSGSATLPNQILGVATHDIGDNSKGYVTTEGLVHGLNTNAFVDGDPLYVSTTAGTLTNIPPQAPFEVTHVGVCVKASPGASGIIYVHPQEPIDFYDLSSVLISGSYHYGDLWVYTKSGSYGVWTHTNQLSGSYGLTGSITFDSGGVTGSLFGTSSWAYSSSYAVSASYITASNVLGPYGSNSILSASYAVSASYVTGIGSSNFRQSFTNQSTWTVSHNLNTQYVLVQTYNSADQQTLPQTVTLTDANTATVVFPTNETGYALVTVGGALQLTSASYAASVGILNQNLIISGNIIPAGPYTNNTSSYDLGSATAAWRDIYVSNGSIKMISGSNSASIQFNNGTLTFTGAAVALPSSSTSPTASYALQAVSSSFATNANSASYVSTLNQDVIVSGSLIVGSGSNGPSENTLTLGARDTAGEGGQLGLNASGGTYTSASFIDVYQNSLRILRGPNNGSNASLAAVNLQNGNLTLNTGAIVMPSRPAFRVSGSSVTGISATTTITSTQGAVVEYNQGSYYNNTTGIFTAPIAGLYHVYFNCRTQTAGSQQVNIYKNTSILMMMWESNTNTGHFGISSILNLAANDTLQAKVTVGTVQFDNNDNWGVAYIG